MRVQVQGTRKQSGVGVAFHSCQIFVVLVHENTPPSLSNQCSSLGPILSPIHQEVYWTPNFFGPRH